MTFASRQREHDLKLESEVAIATVVYNADGLEIRAGEYFYVKTPRINSEPRWIVFSPVMMSDRDILNMLKNKTPDWYDNHTREERAAVINVIRNNS